jgi:uncharacterized protein (DUF2384 family)
MSPSVVLIDTVVFSLPTGALQDIVQIRLKRKTDFLKYRFIKL